MLSIMTCNSCKTILIPNNVVNTDTYPICRRCYNTQSGEMKDFEAPDKIDENLWLGSCYSDIDLKYLQEKNIAGVVLVCPDGIERFPKQIVYHKIEILDTLDADLLSHLDSALCFIRSLIESNKGVLIRCSAGVSRSVAVVIGYLIKFHSLKYDKAFKLVQSKRPIIDPNSNFIKQLKQYESTVNSI